MILHKSNSVGFFHQGRPSLDDRLSYLTFRVADNMFSGWRWRVFCMGGWCATFALRFIFVRFSSESDDFVSKAIAFHVGVKVEPGSAIYGLWLLHRITETNNAHAMTAALNEVWLEHSNANRSLDYTSWRCWTLYSLAMCIARKFIQDETYCGWAAWIELDNTLIRQLEISILRYFPLWSLRVVEGGQGWIRHPDYWQPGLAKFHQKAQLLEVYVTPDEHSVALNAFEEAFGCVGSEALVDGWDTDSLGMSCPQYPSYSSPLSMQSQSPLNSTSPLVENLDLDTEPRPPSRIGSFKTSLTSLPSSRIFPTTCDNHGFFGSPETDNGYEGPTDSPPRVRSPGSALGLWRVSGFRTPPSPIHSTESAWSREDAILISDLTAQSELPSVIFGSPPPHSFTSWSSSVTSAGSGVTLRKRVCSSRDLKWRNYTHKQSISQSRYLATVDGEIWA